MHRRTLSSIPLRFTNRVISTRRLGPNTVPDSVPQSTHFFLSHSCVVKFGSFGGFYNAHQLNLFSSRPDSMVTGFWVSNQGSKSELEGSNPSLTHEDAIYILKKLEGNPSRALDFFNWVSFRNEFESSSILYSLLLRVLASEQECMKQFWVVVKEMKEKGFYIDEETYLTILAGLKKKGMDKDVVALKHFHTRMIQEIAEGDVVKNVVDLIVQSSFNHDVEGKLSEIEIPVSDNFVLRVLKELRPSPLKALEFFRWVGKRPGYEHGSVTYNVLARVLAQRESIKEFWEVVKGMRSEGIDMDVDNYVKISRNFQKNNMVKDAVELYEFMMDGPYELTDSSCVLLLRKIASEPDMDLLSRVTKKYEAAGHSQSKSFYDVIHRALTSLGRFDEAEKIMESMKTAGFNPDNITYSQLVFGLCKAHRLEEAHKVLDEMNKNGCTPDVKTWTILIQGHCAANQMDKAVLLFAEMMENNVDLDGDLLDVLVNGFLSVKKPKGAYKLLVEMANSSLVKPWQATYKLLIENLLSNGLLEEALNLLRMMKKHEYPPYPDPFVRYISKHGTVDDAMQFLSESSVKKKTSSAAYVHIIRGFFNEGRHSEAKDLLYRSPPHVRNNKEIGILFGSTKSDLKPKSLLDDKVARDSSSSQDSPLQLAS